jgi:hypothetical protein
MIKTYLIEELKYAVS